MIRAASEPHRVLLTGASGLLGSEILSGLLRAGHRVTAIAHRRHEFGRVRGKSPVPVPMTSSPTRDAPLISVTGDVCAPALGISADLYEQVQASTRLIVHCAAVTRFGQPRSTYERVNLGGTCGVIDFAGNGGRSPIPILHVSTAYVCGERRNVVREAELDRGQTFANDYERSKFESEVAIHAARRHGVPAVIVRPSIIVGAERTGRIRDFANLYLVLRLLTEGRVTSLPADYGALLDLVPIDYVTQLIMAVVRSFQDCEGKTFHAVGRSPFSLREVSDVLAEYPSFNVPRFVPVESFDSTILPAAEQEYYHRVISLYAPYLRFRAQFADDHARALLTRKYAVAKKTFLRALLNRAVREGYLGRGMRRTLASGEPLEASAC